MDNIELHEGDEVRALGCDVVMRIECTNMGPDGMFHGIPDAVLCGWKDKTGDREEIYPPSSLIVVRRAADRE